MRQMDLGPIQYRIISYAKPLSTEPITMKGHLTFGSESFCFIFSIA